MLLSVGMATLVTDPNVVVLTVKSKIEPDKALSVNDVVDGLPDTAFTCKPEITISSRLSFAPPPELSKVRLILNEVKDGYEIEIEDMSSDPGSAVTVPTEVTKLKSDNRLISKVNEPLLSLPPMSSRPLDGSAMIISESDTAEPPMQAFCEAEAEVIVT